ncbi:MAG: hypothetical protein INF89_19335 [Roseomonas sp.]|nr:hypothetical protein [Roseomonas sp.]
MTANHKMTTTTEEAELHRHQIEEVRLLRLAAERIAERNARFKAEAEFSHMQRRIARQRRALAKLYQRRNDKNTRLSGFLTGMTAALATARKDALEEAAQALIEKYQSMVIRPDTPEAWRFAILQDLREMAGKKPNVITAAEVDARIATAR